MAGTPISHVHMDSNQQMAFGLPAVFRDQMRQDALNSSRITNSGAEGLSIVIYEDQQTQQQAFQDKMMRGERNCGGFTTRHNDAATAGEDADDEMMSDVEM